MSGAESGSGGCRDVGSVGFSWSFLIYAYMVLLSQTNLQNLQAYRRRKRRCR